MNSRMLQLLLLIVSLLVAATAATAHNPLSARYQLVAGEAASLLTINLSQSGVDQALLKEYGSDKLATLNSSAYEELLVNYIKENFELAINDESFLLQQGGVKLGSHQTDLKFVLPGIDGPIRSLDVHISAFRQNPNHQTIFVYSENGETEHAVLSAKNKYQFSLNGDWDLASIGSIGLAVLAFLALLGYYHYGKRGLAAAQRAD